MQLQLIRSATMKIDYAGRTLLTDPMLSPKDAFDGFAGPGRNPAVDLPCSVVDVTDGLDAVVISHVHLDHYDPPAGKALPKSLPLFCQPGDQKRFRADGFRSVIPIETAHIWEQITLRRIDGRHGKGKILERMGTVSGFVIQAAEEPTVYWVGDSIWCAPVQAAIQTFAPDVIITHSGGATLPGYDPIIMDVQQTLALVKASPQATVVAVHLEALDHCGVSRRELRDRADQAGIDSSRLVIPQDGETLTF